LSTWSLIDVTVLQRLAQTALFLITCHIVVYFVEIFFVSECGVCFCESWCHLQVICI